MRRYGSFRVKLAAGGSLSDIHVIASRLRS